MPVDGRHAHAVCLLWVNAVSYHLKPLFSNASCTDVSILLSPGQFTPVWLKMTQAFFICLGREIAGALSCSFQLLRVFLCAWKMINKLNVCFFLICCVLICFSPSRPGVVSEQKSAHVKMQRGQKSPVAVRQPGPRCPAATRQKSADGSGPSGPTASLPNAGERGDGGGLLLQAARLLHRWQTLWLFIWPCAGKTTGRPPQSKHEGPVVPVITSCPCVVPISTGVEKLHFQPDEFHESGISGATVVHVLLRIPFFHSRYPRFWVLGCCHG